MERLKTIGELAELRESLSKDFFNKDKKVLKVCCGLPCSTLGSHEVANILTAEISNLGQDVKVVRTGCQGLCQRGPLVKVEPYGYMYQRVKQDKAKKIPYITFSLGEPVRDLLYRDSYFEKPVENWKEVPFYSKQLKIALRNTGEIDPLNIYDYISFGGYKALEKVLSSMSPEEVIEEVRKSNLRGRGGAGFPTGVKWAHTRRAPGKVKIVIANGDEGDPGAFMDRSIMEGDPHSLLEGMLICAYAIGAQYGIIYVRHEYPLAIQTLRKAIKQANEVGLLGENILSTGFDFQIYIKEGAGAFVCGEATALVASVEGKRGFPHPRPPRVSEPGGGPWGYPANLNNIETYACVPPIIERGADWFLSIGTPGSSGTKVFSLAGKVKNTGLVEVPMGITLREIIFDIGGGIIGDKKFKAVQTGGPSGGCIPEQYLDTPVDFDSLTKLGSIMGSGGMVVMDEDNCMVDVAKFFLSFTQAESCGKCPPCRIGTYQMLQLLEKITSGNGEEGDIRRLEYIGNLVKRGSLCGLGQSAPNPVLTTIRYFRKEYEEHVYEKFCSANVCSIGALWIDQEECVLCGLCKQVCAFDAVKETRNTFFIEREYCTKCKACYNVCPVQAVKVLKPKYVQIKEEFEIPVEILETMETRSRMSLKDILKSKPHEIITIDWKKTILDAVELMSRKNVSGLFVVDEAGKLVNIFTERDIVRCLYKNIPYNENLFNLPERDLTVFDPSISISSAISIASMKKIRHLPIIENDEIKGMITYRDLVLYLLPEIVFTQREKYQ